MDIRFMLCYEGSECGVRRVSFDSWEAADAAGRAMDTDWLTPNVDPSRLMPKGWHYEGGIFDEHMNRFAVVACSVADWFDHIDDY